MDKMRWRYEDTNAVVAAVDSATVIEIGDLLWQDTDDAKPASVCSAWVDSLKDHPAANRDPEELQEEFARTFLGVAIQRSRSGDTAPIRVATTGVFEFDYDAGGNGGTFELGDLVGAAIILHPGHRDIGDGGETSGLMNQHVDKVTDSRYAIARVAKREPTAVNSVLVAIRSTVMNGGILVR